MRRLLLLFIITIGVIDGYTQGIEQYNLVRVTGRIINRKTLEPVPYAHIINLTRGRGTSADENGEFYFSTGQSDTIKFTSIGYDDYYLCLSDSLPLQTYTLVIYLKSRSYLLQEVDIYANDPMKGFRRDTTRITKYRFSTGSRDPVSQYLGAKPIGSGYITAFANLFNQHYQQEKKLQKILEEEESKNKANSMRMLADQRYNEILVNEITGLKGDDLSQFMASYQPSVTFILTATDYEMALYVLSCFRDYRFRNKLDLGMDEILERAVFGD